MPRISKKRSSKKKSTTKKGRRRSVSKTPGLPARYAVNVPLTTIERKQILGQQVQIATPANAAFTSPAAMNLLATGSGNSNRVGNVVTFTNVEIRYTYYPGVPTAGLTPNSQCRIVVVYDKDAKGADPVGTDIFAGNAVFNSTMRNNFAGERFLILADHISEMSQGESDTADRMLPVSGVIRIPCKLQTIYQGSGAVITDIAAGSISLCAAGNAANASTGTLEFNGTLLFTDA